MDRLEVKKGTQTPLGFEKLFLNQSTPLDDNSIAYDKLSELQLHRFVQEYITEYNKTVVALHELAREDAIKVFVYGLKP